MQSIRNQDRDRLHSLNQELSLTNLFMSFGITATLFFVAVGLFALHQSEDGWFLATVGASIIMAIFFAGMMIHKRKQVMAAHRVHLLFSRMHESQEFRELIALAVDDKVNLHEKVVQVDETLYVMQYAAIKQPHADHYSLVVFIYGQLGDLIHPFRTIREIDLYKLFLNYKKDGECAHWTNNRLIDTIGNQEIIKEAKRVPVGVLDALAPLIDKIQAARLIVNDNIDYHAKKAILSTDMSLIGFLERLDDKILLDWCNAHLTKYNNDRFFDHNVNLMNQIEAILPELVNDWSLILPVNVLEALGEHCISNANEQSLGYYCCCLSRLDVYSAGNTHSHDPNSNNLWLLRFAAGLNKDQRLYAVAKFILLKYPPEVHLLHDNEDLINFQEVFGVNEAIARFPHAKRLFIENDLGM